MGTIARMSVDLAMNSSDFEAGIDRAQQKTDSLMSKLGKAGGAMSAAVTLPLVGIATMALKSAGDFESSMNVLQSVSGASTADMATMTEQALKLGAETSFSAGEAAAGMLELGKAGMSAEQIMSAMPGVLSLAAAGNMDVGSAAGIASNAVNTFGLNASAATDVANIFAAAANASSADVSDLAAGFQMAGSVFASNNQSVDNLATSMAILANNGIAGSDAGTSLKTMMMRLAAPTDDAAAVMSELGINVYNADGSMRDFEAIIGNLESSTAGLTDSQRNMAYTTLFGADAIRAASILAESGAEGFAEMEDAVTKAGAAEAAAAARMKGFNGAMDYLKGSIDSVLITMGTPFLDTLGNILRTVADLIVGFTRLSPEIQNAALAFAAVMAAAGPVMMAISAVGTALAFLATPLGLIVVGVALLAAAWAADFMGLRTLTIAVVGAIVSRFNDVAAAFSSGATSVSGILGELGAVFFGLNEDAYDTTEAIFGFVNALSGGTADYFAVDAAIRSMGAAFQSVVGIAQDAVGKISSVASSIATAFGNTTFPTLDELWQQFSAGDFAALGQTIASTAYELMVNLDTELNLSAKADALREKMVGVAASAVAAVSAGFASIDWASAVSAANTAWDTLKESVISAITSIDWAGGIGAASAAWEALKAAVIAPIASIDWAGGVAGASTSFESFKASVIGAITSVDWAGSVASAGDILAGFVSGVVGKLTSIDWAGGIAAAQGMVDSLRDNTINAITGAIGAIDWASAGTIITDAINGLADFVRSVDVTQIDWANFVIGKLLGPLGTALTTIAWVISSDKFAGFRSSVIAAITAIDWGAIAGALLGLSLAIREKFLQIVTDIPADLAAKIAAIDWSTLSLDTARMLTTWGENIAAIDWSVLGQQLGANLRGIFTGDKENPFASLKDAIVNAVADIKWGDLGTALAGFTGAIADSIGEFLSGLFGELGLDKAIVSFPKPEWLEGMLAWKWPDILPILAQWQWPSIASILATWKWPSISSVLAEWEWPAIEMPGWVQSFLDAFAWMNPLAGKAAGGPVTAGTTYMVGERGPELFTTNRSGSIIPNDELGGAWNDMAVGASGAQVTVYATVANDIDVHALAYQVATEIGRWRR